MAAAVARHEHHVLAVQHAEQELVGGLAERRGDPPPRRVLEAGDVVDAAAAQNSQHRHSPSPRRRLGVSSRPRRRTGEIIHGQARRQDHHRHRRDQRHRPAHRRDLRGRRAPRCWRPAAARSSAARSRQALGKDKCLFVKADATQEADVKAMFDACLVEVGPARLPVQQCRRPGAGGRHRDHPGRGLRRGDGDAGALGDARHEACRADHDEAGLGQHHQQRQRSPAAAPATRPR